jgi:hypothetical protein
MVVSSDANGKRTFGKQPYVPGTCWQCNRAFISPTNAIVFCSECGCGFQ